MRQEKYYLNMNIDHIMVIFISYYLYLFIIALNTNHMCLHIVGNTP